MGLREVRETCAHLKFLLLAVPLCDKASEVLCLLPICRNLWQAKCLACKWEKIPEPSLFSFRANIYSLLCMPPHTMLCGYYCTDALWDIYYHPHYSDAEIKLLGQVTYWAIWHNLHLMSQPDLTTWWIASGNLNKTDLLFRWHTWSCRLIYSGFLYTSTFGNLTLQVPVSQVWLEITVKVESNKLNHFELIKM